MRREGHGLGCACFRCTYRTPANRDSGTPASREFLADPMGTLREQLERAKPWPEEQRKAARDVGGPREAVRS